MDLRLARFDFSNGLGVTFLNHFDVGGFAFSFNV